MLPIEDMNTQTKSVHQYHKLAWEPYPQKIQVGKFLVKLDGKNLPNSVTEDIGGFPLCPKYSKQQLRKIDRLQTRKNDRYRKENLKGSYLAPRRNIRESKRMLFSRACKEEIGI
jgi:hypothetical protein